MPRVTLVALACGVSDIGEVEPVERPLCFCDALDGVLVPLLRGFEVAALDALLEDPAPETGAGNRTVVLGSAGDPEAFATASSLPALVAPELGVREG